MSAVDTLFFDDFDTVASPTGPILDGFFFDDIGMAETTLPPETGYIGGGRYTFSGGSEPMGLVQTARDGDKLILGFFSRFDQQFNANDVIHIWLKPSAGASRAQHRRIEIVPVEAALGATGAGGTHNPTNDIFTNAQPQIVRVWKGHTDAGNPDVTWTTCSQAITSRVRSWRPPSALGGVGWSVEVEIPTAAGTDWIALGSSFRLLFQMIRQLDISGSTAFSVLQFPRLPKFTGFLDGNTADIPGDSVFGTALVGTGASEGVRFKNASYTAIGRRLPGGTISQSMSKTSNTLVARIENLSIALDAPGVTAEFRFGKYGLPPGGTTSQWHEWRQPSGMSAHTQPPKRTAPVTLPIKPAAGAAPSADLIADWTLNAADADFKTNTHRCMIAILHSTANVNFSQASIRANTDFVEASEVERDVEVSGDGYEEPADGGTEQEFVLLTFSRIVRGPDILQFDPQLTAMTATSQLMGALLTHVIPRAEDDQEVVETPFCAAPARLRWLSGDTETRSAMIAPRGEAKRVRVRVLPPTSHAAEAFAWEGVDTEARGGHPVALRVTPVSEAGESAREHKLHYQILHADAQATGREVWEVVDAGEIDLVQSARNGLKPGATPADALAGAEALLLITCGMRRTGETITVGGITGEVLDETPGEFALAALHQGLEDAFAWSLSGPALEWLRPGVSIVRAPHGGATQLDLRLYALPREHEQVGDLGPRYVQADPLVLEWGVEESDAREVTFHHRREGAPHGMLRLEVAEPASATGEDFVWKGIDTRLPYKDRVAVTIRPPRSRSQALRSGEMPYRVSDFSDGGRRILETGRIRLIKQGSAQTQVPGEEPSDRPGCLWFLGSLFKLLRRLFP